MRGDAIVAQILKAEGVEQLFCFPANSLIDQAAAAGIRPIMARTERTLINMADGFTRVSNGRKNGVCAVQNGPGIENAFGGVAQAYADSTPILLLPDQQAQDRLGTPPTFDPVRTYAPITRWAERITSGAGIAPAMRRAFARLRLGGRPGPVLVELPRDVGAVDHVDGVAAYRPVSCARAAADPRDVEAAVKALFAAKRPLILAGQGVLYAEAWEALRSFAELTGVPVATTMAGKSAFPENHPLAAGLASAFISGAAAHWLREADLILGIGTSFTRSLLSPPIPAGKTLVHCTQDPDDTQKDYAAEIVVLGDLALVLPQLVDAARQAGAPREQVRADAEAETQRVKQAWLESWRPVLTADETPINPYRVIWELMQGVDRHRTIVTHDSGHPRDQIAPFWETLIPRGYLGWGKSTQLGSSLGLAMGAKLAAPEKLVAHVLGDAAFGMAGMDVETAVRERLPILSVVLNNGALGGYERHMPIATERYRTKFLSGSYAAVAAGLGAWSERVERPADLAAAIQRARAAVEGGQPALLEVITREEQRFSRFE